MQYRVLIFSLLLLPLCAHSQISFKSGKQQARLIELFTSQGCNSCPPADTWLNKLDKNSELWKTIVPVAYHVDYWDYLGWEDPFSSNNYSIKQRNYKRRGNLSSVYTPAFMVNGQEWRGYHKKKSLPPVKPATSDIEVTVKKSELMVRFTHKKAPIKRPAHLYIAILGLDVKTQINAGENADTKPNQNFVTLEYARYKSKKGSWNYPMPEYKRAGIDRYAVAIWASDPKSDKVLQATGGWLP